MEKNSPICSFPTSVIFIDDQYSFLESISITLDNNLAYHLYDKPTKALQHIKNQNSSSYEESFLCQCITYDDSYPSNMDINVYNIHKKIFDQERFSSVSVIIVDYAMPSMNGLEFCKRLQNIPVKKIMLTGEADERLAVKAFNDGMIDKFILKGQPELSSDINLAIKELQRSYFRDLSRSIFDSLIHDPDNSYACLRDVKFTNFFDNFCKQHNIIEFYLLEKAGSFLLVDYDGHCSVLVVKTGENLNDYYDAAENDGATDGILAELKSRKKIPYFGIDKNFWDIKASEWTPYLHEAKKIEGNAENYYYAFVQSSEYCNFGDNEIFPYRKYLNKVMRKI